MIEAGDGGGDLAVQGQRWDRVERGGGGDSGGGGLGRDRNDSGMGE